MFRDDDAKRKRPFERMRERAVKTKRPDPGNAVANGLGKQGRIGATGGTLLTQYILKNQVHWDKLVVCCHGPCWLPLVACR
jgi:hypothetical protein